MINMAENIENKKYDSTYSILLDILDEVKQGGGGSCNLQEVSTTITTNGPTTITADPEFDGISTANVTVAVPEPYLIPLEVTQNGTYVPEMDVDGYSDVTVNVPAGGGPIRLADHPGMRLGYSKFKTFTNDDYDFTGIQDFSNMFEGSRLISIPLFDTSSVTSMFRTFKDCYYLQTIPQFDTSNVSSVSYLFDSDSELDNIPKLNFSNVIYIESFFGQFGRPNITTLGGFTGLKVDWNDNGGLNKCPNLTKQSVLNVINELYDFRANGDASTTKTIKFHANSLALLSDEEKLIATNKGWNLVS